MSMIIFDKVGFSYPNGVTALEEIDFSIQEGENIVIVGQNGAGKTTAVKMINGLLKPTTGSVTVGGLDTGNFTAARLSRQAGYVFQNPDDQIFHSTVRQEIEFGPRVLGFDAERTRRVVDFAVRLTRLSDQLEQNPYNLPLSLRKFVTIASVLAMDTPVLILDEPTAGQDLYGLDLLESMLKELSAQGRTMITITHDMEFAAGCFSKMFVMAHHRLLRVDAPRRIFQDDALLEQAMLKRPFVSSVVHRLGLNGSLVTNDELADCLAGMRREGGTV